MLQQPMQQVPQGGLAEPGQFSRTTSTGVRRPGARVMEGAGADEGSDAAKVRRHRSDGGARRQRRSQATSCVRRNLIRDDTEGLQWGDAEGCQGEA